MISNLQWVNKVEGYVIVTCVIAVDAFLFHSKVSGTGRCVLQSNNPKSCIFKYACKTNNPV